ncbi:MAG: polymerase Rpb6 [Clostridia bacterium]|jgi:DNA-directed RNA polymerase subunit K/omega|nr:polymerase Rpb6 [Clostridia bacterium]
MLSKPNVNELIKKAGNRYEVAIAIAKRAREIAQRRLERGDANIKDTVDLAATEIYEEKALVKISGEYVLKNKGNDLDMDTVISNTVEGILKDLAVKDELLDLEKPKKAKKVKKVDEDVEKKVTEIVDKKKEEVKVAKKAVKQSKKEASENE